MHVGWLTWNHTCTLHWVAVIGALNIRLPFNLILCPQSWKAHHIYFLHYRQFTLLLWKLLCVKEWMTGKFVSSKSLAEGKRTCSIWNRLVVGNDRERCQTRHRRRVLPRFQMTRELTLEKRLRHRPYCNLVLLWAFVACYVSYKILYSPHSLSVSLSWPETWHRTCALSLRQMWSSLPLKSGMASVEAGRHVTMWRQWHFLWLMRSICWERREARCWRWLCRGRISFLPTLRSLCVSLACRLLWQTHQISPTGWVYSR